MRILILAGGGARGIIQAGMLQQYYAIDKNPMPDAVVGISVGALNGAMFVQQQFTLLFDIWRNISNDKVFSWNILNSFGKGASLAKPTGLEKLIKEHVWLFKERRTGLPIHIGVSNTLSSKSEFFVAQNFSTDDDLRLHLLASISAPVYFPPVRIEYPGTHQDYKIFIDGGILDNFPLDYAVTLLGNKPGPHEIIMMTGTSLPDGKINNLIQVLEYVLAANEWAQLNVENRIIHVLEHFEPSLTISVYQPAVPNVLGLLDFNLAGKQAEAFMGQGRRLVQEGPTTWKNQ